MPDAGEPEMPYAADNGHAPARSAMSADHKAALAQGRAEGRIVRTYLTALEQRRTGRGRRRTRESVARQLATVESKLDADDPLERLHLVQQREDLQAELARAEPAIDLATAEERFVEVAASYAERKGIGYAAWRTAGVSPAVLQRAGIRRTTTR